MKTYRSKEMKEAYDKDGNFIVSGDTYREAVNELLLLSKQ